MRFARILLVVLLMAPALSAAGTLEMYAIDVGGKSFLLISPTGETLLIDAGVASRHR